jgi:hypothetical protein
MLSSEIAAASSADVNLRSTPARCPAAWFVLAAGFLLKAVLLICFPALYGGDTVFHLRNHEHLMVAHQPPMLQVLIYVMHRVSTNPIACRLMMISIGAFAGLGFYLLCRRLMNATAAFWAALFFVTNPFLNEVSLVPFQEILLVGLLCFAIYCYLAGHLIAASAVLACACWTRYEGWIICPVLIVDYLNRKRWTPMNGIRAALLFAAGPLVWIGMHHGLSSSGSYAIEIPRTAARLVRWIYLCWVCIKQTPIPVVLFAMMFVWYSWMHRHFLRRDWQPWALFAALYFLAILSAAHGIGHPGAPNPELFLGAREATLLVCFTLLLAALGFSQLLVRQSGRWLVPGLGVTAVALGVLQSWFLVRSQASAPDVVVSYEVARYLTDHVKPSEKVLFVAKPFTESDWSYYLEQAERLQGTTGLAAARASLRQLDLSPMEYQRTAVQTNLPESNLIVDGNPDAVTWIVTWSDAVLPATVSASLPAFRKAEVLRKGNLAATLWKHSSGG